MKLHFKKLNPCCCCRYLEFIFLRALEFDLLREWKWVFDPYAICQSIHLEKTYQY